MQARSMIQWIPLWGSKPVVSVSKKTYFVIITTPIANIIGDFGEF